MVHVTVEAFNKVNGGCIFFLKEFYLKVLELERTFLDRGFGSEQ